MKCRYIRTVKELKTFPWKCAHRRSVKQQAQSKFILQTLYEWHSTRSTNADAV